MFTVLATAAHLVAFNGAVAARADEREDTCGADEDLRLGSWITKTGG
jgi:hypothetical protein